MIIRSLQTRNRWLYEDCESIEDYRKKLESLIDITMSEHGGVFVDNGTLTLTEPIWGKDLSDAAKSWVVERGKTFQDFRDKIIEWLFDHKERSK